jgi:competence protein ComEC
VFRWIPYAFVRIVFFFIAGILMGIHFPGILATTIIAGGLVLFAILFIACSFSRGVPKPVIGVFGLLSIFLGGWVDVQMQAFDRSDKELFKLFGATHFRAIVAKPPTAGDRTWRYEATITAIRFEGTWLPARSSILLYAHKDRFEPFVNGDVLIVDGAPRAISAPSNPGEFDYRRYLLNRSIVGSRYLRGDDAIKVDFIAPDPVPATLQAMRDWGQRTLAHYIASEREGALAAALIFGVRDGLDDDLTDAYAAAGAMHVLAVSGLHVGIIYGLLILCAKPLGKRKRGKWIIAGLSLVVLWVYAGITGFSPSVLRAVSMFSFFAVAIPLRRRTNTYNMLAASAFCILLINPFQIASVGFQLSYLAVLGIVALQPNIYRLYEAQNSGVDYVWRLTSVSIAAQCATFPLGALYFHQFPNYFLLSNIVVIPAAAVIVVLGLVLLAVSWIPSVAVLVGWLLGSVIKLMNAAMIGIQNLPFSIVDNIHITPTECILIIILLVFVVQLWMTRKPATVVFITAAAIALSASMWHRIRTDVMPHSVTIYDVPGQTVVDFFYAGKGYNYHSWKGNRPSIDYFVRPNRMAKGTDGVGNCAAFSRSFNGGELMSWHGRTFLVATDALELPPNSFVDYLIVSNNAVSVVTNLADRSNVGMIIFDSSNSPEVVDDFIRQHQYDQDLYSVLHDGAWNLTL